MQNKFMAALISSAIMLSSFPAVSGVHAQDGAVYSMDFEAEGLEETIKAQTDGWSYDSDNGLDKVDISINADENTSNALRFSSTDWYKSMWIDLDLKENWVSNKVSEGEDRNEAEAAVDGYLSGDMTLSFRAKLDVDGISDKPEDVHESFIKIKNEATAAVAEIRTKDDKLYLSGLSEDEYYEIKTIDISKENEDWHEFEFTFYIQTNTYRLSIDGSPIEVNGSYDIRAGAQDGETNINKISTFEFGHFWSGWWQRLMIDDINISTDVEAPEPGESQSPKPTAPEQTSAPEQGVLYYEPFEDSGIESEIKGQENGWSNGAAASHEGVENISVDSYGGGSRSYRFASSDWYKNIWSILDLQENGVHKRVLNGENEAQAQAEVDEYLRSDMKLSFRACFEADGTDTTTHEQYIRIKGSDGHVITDIHLYNNELKLIAFDETCSANTAYDIKTVDWSKNARDWHDFAVYYDFERNAYMVEVDGEIVKNTPHGRWIPAGSGTGIGSSSEADIGKIQSIEMGHYWSAWWGALYIDDIKLTEYEPPQDEFEIVNVSIRNEYDSETLVPGGGCKAVVNVAGGEAESMTELWSYTDNGSDWYEFTGGIIPKNASAVRVKVTAVDKDGNTAEFTATADVSPVGAVIYETIATEDFESADKETEINNQTDGWTIKGSSAQADVGNGFGGDRNALRFASTNSNANSNLQLDFAKRGASYSENDRIRLSFEFAFGLDSSTTTITPSSSAYVRVKDTEGNAFTAINLLGDTMSLLYYDDELGKVNDIELAKGRSKVIDVWRSVEIYLDTAANKYCVCIDGSPIGKDKQKWFTPANSIVKGTGVPITVKGIGAVDIGQEKSTWWSSTYIDNISLEKYYVPDTNAFTVQNITVSNAYSEAQPVAAGSSVKAAPVISADGNIPENTKVTDCIYSWEYILGDGETVQGTDVIPYNAVSGRVKGVFKNLVGQQAECEKEFSVTENTAPRVSGFAVSGEFKTGEKLTASYVFEDSETPDSDNTVVNWYRAGSAGGEYTLIAENTSEYTLTGADVTRYIKVIATPIDIYGAKGEEAVEILSSGEMTDFDKAWARLNINTKPSSGTASITLPLKDEETGITFVWSSSNTSVISNSGMIVQQSSAQTVVLTVTASNAAGETQTRNFTIAVPAKSASVPSYGGGGGGAGGGGGGSMVPTPTKAPIPTSLPQEETGMPGSAPSEELSGVDGQRFADVKAGAWYYEYVTGLAEMGIVNGGADGLFRPDDTITRCEFSKMLVEALGIYDDSAVCDFADVNESDWFVRYVASAVKFDIVNGLGDGNFAPHEQITREDMAVMAFRAAELMLDMGSAGEPEFNDADKISDYAKNSVAQMQKAQILSGSSGNFEPKNSTTRAQAAKVVYMLVQLLDI